MSTTSATVYCAACGSKEFIKPHEGELQPDDVLTCNGCGRQSTFKVLREQAVKAAKKAVGDMLRKAFKKR